MIFVKRNPELIPTKLLNAAKRAQAELETLPAEQRGDFIKRKSGIWREFLKCLAQMSYGKCWYSEARESHSFFDVDHFRPKAEAKRAEGVVDAGYHWLAFDWQNFRYSAQRSNRLSTNETTQTTEGKGSWFPLLPESPKATWDNQCEASERPILLDPTVPEDVHLVTIADDGRVVPSRICVGRNKKLRVEESAKILGLNLGIKEVRQGKILEVLDLYKSYEANLMVADKIEQAADGLPIDRLFRQLRRWTHPDQEFSLTVRATLDRLGASYICAPPEEWSSTSVKGTGGAVPRANGL